MAWPVLTFSYIMYNIRKKQAKKPQNKTQPYLSVLLQQHLFQDWFHPAFKQTVVVFWYQKVPNPAAKVTTGTSTVRSSSNTILQVSSPVNAF